MGKKAQTELRAIKKEIANMRTRLTDLEARQAELEHAIKPTQSVTTWMRTPLQPRLSFRCNDSL
jgi:hypothetical protein